MELFGGAPSREGSTFKEFMDCKPLRYHRGENALECLCQIMKMDHTFCPGDFTECQNVNYVARMFESEALKWWDAVENKTY